MREAQPVSTTTIDGIVAAVSNWGRFGPDDEHGTVNLIDEPAIRRGLAAARSATTIALARPLGIRATLDNPRPMLHHMLRSGEHERPGFCSASDWIGLEFHGFGTTHLDALSHVMWNGRLYNDVPGRRITTDLGATTHSVEALVGRVRGRGVLLDVPRSLGIGWLEPGWTADPDDLDRCCADQGVTIEAGDIVLVRFGRDWRTAALGAHDPIVGGFGGLSAECAAWVHAHDVAVLGSDGVSDVMRPGAAPHLMPIHVACLVAMGTPLIDNMQLEQLAAVCSERLQWTFLLVAEPLPLRHSTGSPVAPLAIL